jgi:Aminotransferase class-V
VDHNIATRTGLHCAPLVHKQLGTIQRDGGVRFSIGAFNTAQEVDAAIAGIADISQWARERAAKLHSGPAKRVHEGRAMADSIWTIESISSVGICKDEPGHPTMNANSYCVELNSGKERIKVEVAVTHVASQCAMDCLYGNSPNDRPVETVEQDLVRCLVEKELRDTDKGWNPRTMRWLTIDSHDVQEIVEQLAFSHQSH